MSTVVPSLSSVALCLMIVSLSDTVAKAQEESADLFLTVLIAGDLQDAKKIMTIYDPNEDGYIDQAEQKRVAWRKEIPRFDLNKDGKLTHLEVAVMQAKQRSDSGVTFLIARMQASSCKERIATTTINSTRMRSPLVGPRIRKHLIRTSTGSFHSTRSPRSLPPIAATEER